MELSTFQAMSTSEQWKVFKSLCGNSTFVRAPRSKWCSPNYINPLYTNIPFPNYTSGGTSIELDKLNILIGKLVNDRYQITVAWNGYVTNVYDGEIKMCPVTDNAFIEGSCDGVKFRFEKTQLVYGKWPGFLNIFKKNEEV